MARSTKPPSAVRVNEQNGRDRPQTGPKTGRTGGHSGRKITVRMAGNGTYDLKERSHDELKSLVELCLQLAAERRGSPQPVWSYSI